MAAPRICYAARCAFLISVIGLMAAACSGSKAKSTPTAAGTEPPAFTITVTPTAAPADPKLGDTLRYEGDFEGAIGVYAAVAGKGEGEEQRRARLAQAQLLVRTGDAAGARPVLDAYIAAGGADGDASIARYMLASVLDDLGDAQGALDNYKRYIAANGVLIDFAGIERAKLLARLGRVPEALAAAEAVRANASLLPAFRSSFTFSFASALEAGQADALAIEWYDRARNEGGDAASALARTGGIRKRNGDPVWSADYLQAIAAYPESAVASELLDALDAAAVPVGDYVRGVVDYRAHRNDEARAALSRAIAAGDNAAEATYYLAALDERAGDYEAAIAGYRRAHDLDPASPLADDALWWGGRLLESAERYGEAGAAYTALAESYAASSKWASDAAFRRGLVLYRLGSYAAAALVWSAIVPVASGEDAARARYWQGRALQAQDDPLAEPVLAQLIADTPMGATGSYYALRAEIALGKNDGKERAPNLKQQKTDWREIAKWINDTTGIDPEAAASPLASDRRWDVAAALEYAGLHPQSDAVYRSMLGDNGGENIADLFQVARRFEEEGRTSLAARAAETLAVRLGQPGQQPPEELLRVAYPLAFRDLASTAAKEEKISPLLLLALVRQESFYDPDAGSPAGALGLTQVIPETGEAIASVLGVDAFSASDLYRPRTSLRFGASYLAGQLREFDGNAYHALAAYNGGPGTASNALKSAGADEDLFVEDLEFDETQQYVRRVMENYARYRQLYEGLDRPSLPR
ncbi:MAG: transglycosylase SLT domain-containing protein [Chloroflexi bacterium]|nr:transglycosylase SLT domain-containing protein [Chloroflexota bacterium]